ncbi:B12-binding domain-containing radical SAM protein [Desulfotalea psychrophila]|nr:radical SAM protein [Desulfotalea psychrophila]
MLLLQPPFVKSCEPSAALAQLTAYLRGNGERCFPYDLSIECLHHLLETTPVANDTWSKRAFRNRKENITLLKSGKGYTNYSRYERAVSDINRIIEIAGKRHGIQLNLENYQDSRLSPLKSEDLLYAMEHYRENIFFPYLGKRIASLIDKHNPTRIGLSLNFLSQALPTFAIIGFLKSSFPELKIIVGGGLITSWHKSPQWTNPFKGVVDQFVVGAGEAPLLEIVSGKTDGEEQTPEHKDLLGNNYLAPGYILPFTASIGCYWRKCSFCPETSENSPYICLSNNQVQRDLGSLIEKTRPRLIHFLDSAISPRLMTDLIRQPPGVPWYGFARICEQLTDPDFTRALKKSGCAMLKLGLESGSSYVLEQMNKGISLSLASRVLRSLEQAGIATYVYLLFGTASEDIGEARKTLRFASEHASAITYTNLSIFNLPICSQETETLETINRHEGDLTLYTDFIHPKGWGRKEIRKFLNNEFKRHPLIMPILRENPPFFSSNHAPFFHKNS